MKQTLKTLIQAEYDLLLEENSEPMNVWNVFISLLRRNGKHDMVWYITLLADFQVIKLIANGFSMRKLMNLLNLSRESIQCVADTWGLSILADGLLISPLQVYTEGNSLEYFMESLSELLGYSIPTSEAMKALDNCRQYYILDTFLEEEFDGGY